MFPKHPWLCFPLITQWLELDTQMVVLSTTHTINSTMGRNGWEKGPLARSRKAQDAAHIVGQAVLETARWGPGRSTWQAGDLSWKPATWLPSTVTHVSAAWLARTVSWRSLKNPSLSHRLCLMGFSPKAALHNLFWCHWTWEETPGLRCTSCEGVVRKGLSFLWKPTERQNPHHYEDRV